MNNENSLILSFSTFEELKNIESEWNELYLLSEVHSHYLTFEFVQLWYSCFATPDQIRIYRIIKNNLTIGFLPLVLKSSKGLRTLSSLTNHHCPHCGPLVRKGYDDAFQTMLLEALFQLHPYWDILTFEYSYDFDRFPSLFRSDELNSKNISWLQNRQPTYSIFLGLNFDAWAKQCLSKKTNKTIKSLKSRYKKASSWSLQLFSRHDAAAKWDVFLELENSGWKGAGGSSIKKLQTNYQHYYQGLVRQLAEQDKLIISLLEYESQYIAGSFMYREGDVLHKFKSGYSADFHSLSPSNMLLFEIVRLLGGQPEAPKILHMFPGDYGYKERYATTEVMCSFTVLFNRTFRGQIAYRYRQFKNVVKSRLISKKVIKVK